MISRKWKKPINGVKQEVRKQEEEDLQEDTKKKEFPEQEKARMQKISGF